MTMAQSLEARVPFLDHRLVELVYQLPDEFRLDGRYKRLLREAVRDLVPDRVMNRDKQGFIVPVSQWFRESDEIRNIWFAREMIEETPYLSYPAVIKILNKHRSEKIDRGLLLWKMLTYIGWHQSIIKPHLQ